MKKGSKKWIIGVDEAGRGPLAGPVTVGVFAVRTNVYRSVIAKLKKSGVNDSKQIKAGKREELFQMLQNISQAQARAIAASVSARVIDRIGLSAAIRRAIARGLQRLDLNPQDCEVRLDGLLRAPAEYTNQTTIVRGDQSEIVIGAGSIIAKVTRDKYMMRMAKKYPIYGFDKHKGYGTVVHRKNIEKYGVCPLHRLTWIKK
ncbi:MAG: ribonuclease HII [Candidatus Nomurabacteria bacterium]|nr:ribonuclease HII [Candidatus Nomurabacteria bacterium]